MINGPSGVDYLPVTAYSVARRFMGIKEMAGTVDNPQITAMLRLDAQWPENDEVPWCSAFVNYICWLLNLKRSKSLRARSWLLEGREISIKEAKTSFDVVIFMRGKGEQPGPDVIEAPGHVGFYAGHDETSVLCLGGNQSNEVNISKYPLARVLGIRRLYL